MKRKLVLFGIISALLVVFLSGCSNPTGRTPGVNTEDLDVEITVAKLAKVGVQINSAALESQVAQGIRYVSPTEMTALNTKIASAEAVLGMRSPSQTMVDMATYNLVDAVSNFAIKIGSKTTFNESELSEMIDDARGRIDEVLAGTQSTSAPGTEYVSSEDRTALDSAINDATSVLTDLSASATAVNEAALALAEAIQTFNDKTKTDGKKSSGYTAADLAALINTANMATLGVETSANGANVEPDTFWVTIAVMNTFNAAIATAESATDANRDAQYAALTAAIATFNAAKQLGTKPTPKAITITGLPSSAYGSVIEVGIFEKAPTSPNDPYVAGGDATIQNGSATASLYSKTGLWTGTGSYYVGFYFGDKAYVSKTKMPFVGATTTVAVADCTEMNLGGKTVTITGLPASANTIEVGLFQTMPDLDDAMNLQPTVGGEGAVQNGRATVSLFNASNYSPWTGTGDWYVGFHTNDNKVYITKAKKSFSGNNVNVAVADCNWMEFGGGPSKGVYGSLTVNGNLSGKFAVYIAATTITNSNFSSVMNSDPVAEGAGAGASGELEWFSGNGSGNYSVIIMSEVSGSIRYQNGVPFTNGSGSVNWNSMTEVNVADYSVGTLTLAGGSPGGEWTVLIVSGPLTGDVREGRDAMDAYVAAAPSNFPNGSGGWLIFTEGAKGGTFNPNGTYSVIYMNDEAFKYRNNVSFTNGNATINLSLLSDFDFSDGPIDNPIHTEAELRQLIDDANAAKVGVQVSADGMDVNIGDYWVAPADMAMFEMAISLAESGGDIDARYAALEAAMFSFQNARRPGTKTETTVPDPDELAVSNGILTLTGFDEFEGKYVYPVLETSSGNKPMGLIGAEYNGGNPIVSMARISGGRAEAPLYISHYVENSVAPSLAATFVPYESSETIKTVSIMIVDDSQYACNDSSIDFAQNYAALIGSNPANESFKPNINFGNFTISRNEALTQAEMTSLGLMLTTKYILLIGQSGGGPITSWTENSAVSSINFKGIAWGGGKFVAVGSETVGLIGGSTTGKIAYSSDGTTWTKATLDPFSSDYSYINGVAWGSGKFVAVGSNNTITTSTDGVNWTNGTFTGNLSNIAWGGPAGNERFVAVGSSGTITHSTDGVNWTPATNTTFTGAINGIAWGNGKWVAVGDSGKMAYSTDNGETWTPATSTFGSSDSIYAVAWGGDKWVAAGGVTTGLRGGTMAYSSDGATWTKASSHPFSSSSSSIHSLAWNNGTWIAGGSGGMLGDTMAYSSNGETWTAARNTPSSFSYSLSVTGIVYGGAAGNKRFVAACGGAGLLGNSGEIWYSNVLEE